MVVGTLWDSCEVIDACYGLKCDSCGLHIELVLHVLWICPIARAVCKRVLKILYLVYGKHMYMWEF